MAITLGGSAYYHKGGVPAAISLWLKTTTTTSNQVIAAQCNSGSSLEGWNIILNNPTAGFLKIYAQNAGSATINQATASATSFNDGNWHHLAANFRFTNGSASELYLDGVQVINVAASAAWTPSGGVDMTIGKSPDNFWGIYPGSVCDVSSFSAVLSQAEITAMAKGFSAKHVCLPKMLMWAPIIRHTPAQNEYDDKKGVPFAGGATLSNAGSESYTDHPRMFF